MDFISYEKAMEDAKKGFRILEYRSGLSFDSYYNAGYITMLHPYIINPSLFEDYERHIKVKKYDK